MGLAEAVPAKGRAAGKVQGRVAAAGAQAVSRQYMGRFLQHSSSLQLPSRSR